MGQGALKPARRRWLASAASLPLWPLAACAPAGRSSFDGGWVGAGHERGHRLRGARSGELPAPSLQRRAGVVIVGAGIAGLMCARALTRAGVDDVQLFDLEDSPGGNSRGHVMGGMRCPLGAHYLPLPGDAAVEVIELLEELGLRRRVSGRVVYDERHLCHSPQERLFIGGHWHEGLLPPVEALPAEQRAPALAQYRRFAELVSSWSAGGAFAIPTARAAWRAELDALDGITFAQWLDRHRFDAPALRWYLDYCCRDDYGAGPQEVSAWAGLHYFASRHGFHAPGGDEPDRDGVLTWPEGNGWLAERLAAPLAGRTHAGFVALRVAEGRHGVDVDFWNTGEQRTERWSAARVVIATPVFIAARLVESAAPALSAAAAQMRYASWLVANLQLKQPLDDRPGAAPSWDNVLFGGASLGYVDAMHQSTRPHPGPTVLSSYWSWGAQPSHREDLMSLPWEAWAQRVLQELSIAHPDLRNKVARVDLMRHGHAMSIPVPGARRSAALRALAEQRGRIVFAHSDLSGYSVFEEAACHGVRAARG